MEIPVVSLPLVLSSLWMNWPAYETLLFNHVQCNLSGQSNFMLGCLSTSCIVEIAWCTVGWITTGIQSDNIKSIACIKFSVLLVGTTFFVFQAVHRQLMSHT